MVAASAPKLCHRGHTSWEGNSHSVLLQAFALLAQVRQMAVLASDMEEKEKRKFERDFDITHGAILKRKVNGFRRVYFR